LRDVNERLAVAELAPIRFSHEKHKKSQRKQLHLASDVNSYEGLFATFRAFCGYASLAMTV
jgi:hypothetical protein